MNHRVVIMFIPRYGEDLPDACVGLKPSAGSLAFTNSCDDTPCLNEDERSPFFALLCGEDLIDTGADFLCYSAYYPEGLRREDCRKFLGFEPRTDNDIGRVFFHRFLFLR